MARNVKKISCRKKATDKNGGKVNPTILIITNLI